ncbi:hypothetical protein DITRI_Ditri13aG0145000 [Diplodiscus trichospermus]
MFTTTMIDVANELRFPSYVFYTTGVALASTLHPSRRQDRVCDTESVIPGYVNPVPSNILDSSFDREGYLLNFMRRFMETEAIVANSFAELESQAAKSLLEKNIPIYMVGPLFDLHGRTSSLSDEVQRDKIMKWLDNQQPCTVVFLCFGSFMPMGEAQAMEIAKGLEQCGDRLLWSARIKRPTNDEASRKVNNCTNLKENIALRVPRTNKRKMTEQQFNAQMVKDLGLTMEMRIDYMLGESDLAMGDEIKKAIKCLMEGDSCEVRMKVKKMSQVSKKAVRDCNGSSFTSFARLIQFIVDNSHNKS